MSSAFGAPAQRVSGAHLPAAAFEPLGKAAFELFEQKDPRGGK